MPNRDKTGPEGKGPKTGRGMGPCGDGKRRGSNRGIRGRKPRGLGRRLRGFKEKFYANGSTEEPIFK